MKPGDVRLFEDGDKSLVLAVGVWAKKDGDWISIHLTGGPQFHTTVTNNPESDRYHRTLFRNLRQRLREHDRWPFGDEGAEIEQQASRLRG